MKHKFITLLIITTAVLSLTACGKSVENAGTIGEDTTQSVAETETLETEPTEIKPTIESTKPTETKPTKESTSATKATDETKSSEKAKDKSSSKKSTKETTPSASKAEEKKQNKATASSTPASTPSIENKPVEAPSKETPEISKPDETPSKPAETPSSEQAPEPSKTPEPTPTPTPEPAPAPTPTPCEHERTHKVYAYYPACETHGYVNVVCDDCGKCIFDGYEDGPGHTWSTTIKAAGNCVDGEWCQDTCTVCGFTPSAYYNGNTDPNNHNWESVTFPPELEGGEEITVMICSTCGTMQ